MKKIWVCPRCKKKTICVPALSRADNKTQICSDCGLEEALINFSKFVRTKKEDKK